MTGRKVNEAMNCGIMYEIFGKYRAPLKEYEVPEYLLQQAAEKNRYRSESFWEEIPVVRNVTGI